MLRVLTTSALAGAFAWGLLAGVSFAPGGPDTSEAVADRIRPGMTLAEAERVIGAPPGDYRLEEDWTIDCTVGPRVPNVVRWATYSGSIRVVDGEVVWMKPRTPEPPRNEPDGVIDSVSWRSYEQASGGWHGTPQERDARWWRRSSRHYQDARWWRLRWPLAVTAAALAGTLLVTRGVRWWRGRKPARGGLPAVAAQLS